MSLISWPLLALLACDTTKGDDDPCADIDCTQDADDDGIPDEVEGSGDTDGDGVPDKEDPDSDGDGMPDLVEAGDDPVNPVDSDGDGTPDYKDTDSDDDTLLDALEAGDTPTNPVDHDADGTPDYLDLESDGDGIGDFWEANDDEEGVADTDKDGTYDFLDPDSDADGVLDAYEGGTESPEDEPVDSDGDGTPDYRDQDSDDNCLTDGAEAFGDPTGDADGDGIYDFQDQDDDGDGLSDVLEMDDCSLPDSDNDGLFDFRDPDSDDDGIADVWEAGEGPDAPVDSDGDGIPDYLDDDSDGDGIPDSEEGGVPPGEEGGEPADTDGDGAYDYLDQDSDGDGLSDSEEAELGTDAKDKDSDGDGVSDAIEDAGGSDPLDASDTYSDYLELGLGETYQFDMSVEALIREADVVFTFDTTGSMGNTLNTLTSTFPDVYPEVDALFESVNYGVASFADYRYSSMGSPGDYPFVMRQQLTDDVAEVETQMGYLQPNGGNDSPESTIEAVYQTLTGAGYDLGCNGTFDRDYDVKPFIASKDDPFGGAEEGVYDETVSNTGDRGGMGFRSGALPVVVYATDLYMRDPDSTNGTLNQTPGGCPGDAGSTQVAEVAVESGAVLIGFDVSYTGSTTAPFAGMEELAWLSGSVGDLDGDGTAEETLVYHIDQYSSTFVTEFRENLIQALTYVLSVPFDEVSIETSGDPHGFLVGTEPEYYLNVAPNAAMSFFVTVEGVVKPAVDDQVFAIDFQVLGDGVIDLGTERLVIVVPAL
jgi:hypothetical protein